MSQQPLVSVLMCSYNAWEYIKQTIESVLCQSYMPFEFLILDNNSSDQTVTIIQSFDDKRIKLIQSKTNLWPYWWLNKLLEQATGEYVAIQDHDDLWHPEKLKKQIHFLSNNTQFIACGTTCKMLFEYDGSYFNYIFPQKSFYGIHPSLVFKNIPGLLYDEKELYMWDAYFQKTILCKWEKRLANIDEVLTTHIVNAKYQNASFSRFMFNSSCIKRIFDVHWFSLYACMVLGFELTRKILYPTLKRYEKYGTIVRLEQLPFRLKGFKIMQS